MHLPLTRDLNRPETTASGYPPPDPLLSKIFPFHLTFNREMQIVQLGESLHWLYPKLTLGSSIQQIFWLDSSHCPFEYDEICKYPGQSFVLQNCLDGLKFQGQMLCSQVGDLIFFLGTPWATDLEGVSILADRLSSHKTFQDITSNYLFLLKVRSASLTETRQLAEQLAAQQANLEQALSQAELSKAVLEQAAEAIEVLDTEARLLYVNAAFEAMTGYTCEEVLGKTPSMLFRAGQHDEAFYDEIWNTISSGQVWQGSIIGRRKEGSFFYQTATLFPVFNQSGEITNYVAIKRDESDRRHAQTQLEQSLSLLQATFEATADGILVSDICGKITHFNRKFTDIWQIPESVLNGRDNQQVMQFIETQLKDPRSLSAKTLINVYVRPPLESNDILELKDGRILERYISPQQVDDNIIGWVWSFRDVTERQRTEAKILYQARYDALTGLPNRSSFNDWLAFALASAMRSQMMVAVMFLDLDRFKLINDTLGHAAGDLLLQAVAGRLTKCVREGDTVARWAGDEFTLLLPNIQTVDNATAIAQRILESLREEFNLDGQMLHISISIGIAFYPSDGIDAETLLKNADAALYRAKEGGRNSYQLYTAAINSGSSERLTLEHQLHRALERQEFILYYQPQVNVTTGKITQMEALLRWQHPEMGLILPGKFIPVAEETGLIVPIGEWALRSACAQNQRWQSLGLPPIRVAVNLSAQQFKQPQLVSMVKQILQETALSPDRLELEITETTMMKNAEQSSITLGELHKMGVSISLDDFGTGYSSLSYLKTFPLNTLKIDQSFIRDLTTDPNDEAIVAAIVAMGKVLKLKLVAEGVETEAQESLLRSFNCDEMQGYLFSKAMPAEPATNFLQAVNLPNSKLWRFNAQAWRGEEWESGG